MNGCVGQRWVIYTNVDHNERSNLSVRLYKLSTTCLIRGCHWLLLFGLFLLFRLSWLTSGMLSSLLSVSRISTSASSSSRRRLWSCETCGMGCAISEWTIGAGCWAGMLTEIGTETGMMIGVGMWTWIATGIKEAEVCVKFCIFLLFLLVRRCEYALSSSSSSSLLRLLRSSGSGAKESRTKPSLSLGRHVGIIGVSTWTTVGSLFRLSWRRGAIGLGLTVLRVDSGSS